MVIVLVNVRNYNMQKFVLVALCQIITIKQLVLSLDMLT